MKQHLLLFVFMLTLVPVNAQELNKTRCISDKYKKIYYTSVADAEKQINQYHKERQENGINDPEHYGSDYFPYDMFRALINSDERTLTHSFSFSNISEILSPDKLLKLYVWTYDEGAIHGNYNAGIFTYKSEESYVCHISEGGSEDWHELIVPLDTYKIDSIVTNEGHTIYMFFCNHRTFSSISSWVEAFILSGKSCEAYHLFNIDGTLSTSIKSELELGFYSAHIEYKDGCLLVPEEGYPYNFYTEICYPSGYIKRYTFNGTRFINKDRIYDTEIPLPEKLRNFKANIVILDFKPWTIRIDSTNNNSFRYISWKNKEMSETPDLIINSGTVIAKEINKAYGGQEVSFTFKNNEYEYVVTYEQIQYNRRNDITPISLIIKRDNTILMSIKPVER